MFLIEQTIIQGSRLRRYRSPEPIRPELTGGFTGVSHFEKNTRNKSNVRITQDRR